MPAVVPVLEKLQPDANEEVRLTARLCWNRCRKRKNSNRGFSPVY